MSSSGTATEEQPGQHIGREFLTRPAEENHIVQFYEDEEFLYQVVADFLGAGFAVGEPLIVIATEPHRRAFSQRLESRGFDVATACRSGQFVLLDAWEMLSRFMVDGMPDGALFKATVGAVIEQSQMRACHARIRAYGEMVDLLWRDGAPKAAICLEELWNDIARDYSFSLLCAYAMDNFGQEAHAQPFHQVCRAHSHVIPTERYSQIGDPDARLREVSLLQQRAQALETEIEHRKQVEQELREALKLRDDFLLVAGHELRTPLTALQLQVQALAKLSPEKSVVPHRERLGRVAQQVKRLSMLVEGLLDVSRISAGRFTLEVEELDLAVLVREAVERAAEAMARSEDSIRVLAEAPILGTWDRMRIEQVVVNLLSNAIKYGKGNPIEVLVTGTADRARVLVRDRGIGILPEDQDRIFDRFERAVSVWNFGGLGLGLWITRQIIEAHGGTIRVESQLGEGATFVVELPYAAGHGPVPRAR